MSYILDALRRSQAERERGQVPGLDAQPVAPTSTPEPARAVPLLWLAGGLGLGGMLALGLWWSRAAPPQARPVAAVPMPAPAPVAAVAPPPLPVVVSAPPVAPAPPPAPPSPPPAAPAVQAVRPDARPAAAPVAMPAAPAAARATPLAELSEQQRREMPPLGIGGSVWSESVLGRFVIVNGQVVREGETAAPGVTVERIAPKSVVMRWRELRFEVPL